MVGNAACRICTQLLLGYVAAGNQVIEEQRQI
jgi:hypothetical protein